MEVLDVSLLMRGPHGSESTCGWRGAVLAAEELPAPCLAALSGSRGAPELSTAWRFGGV